MSISNKLPITCQPGFDGEAEAAQRCSSHRFRYAYPEHEEVAEVPLGGLLKLVEYVLYRRGRSVEVYVLGARFKTSSATDIGRIRECDSVMVPLYLRLR
jgi:hypothetical protein